MITVFTPAYNRAHLLPRLFGSLEAQTCKNFEWVIVDDGSSDKTREVVEGYVSKASFPIRYFHQENGGKHRAINRGVMEAKGELFFIADNDDWLTYDAIEKTVSVFEFVKDDVTFGGICGLDSYADGKIVGSGLPGEIIDANAYDIRYKYHVTGDLKEVFRTDVMREFPFPEFDGERFCPEALVWNRIANRYKLRYFNQSIYFAEYQADGLTANIMKVRHNSPLASMTTYAELCHADVPFKERIKAAINFWRFTPKRYYSQCNEMHMSRWQFIFVPLGVLMRLKDKRQL